MSNIDPLKDDAKRIAAILDPDYPEVPKVNKRKRKDETEGEHMARVAAEEAARDRVKAHWAKLEAIALGILEEAFDIVEERTNFIIVGQLHYSTEHGYLRDNGDRVAFGPYSSLTKAQDAFTQLTYSAATNEEFKAWLLPYHQGTPAQWFLNRKRIREQAADVPLTNAEKLIVKYNQEECWRWGLNPDGTRLKQPGERQAA